MITRCPGSQLKTTEFGLVRNGISPSFEAVFQRHHWPDKEKEIALVYNLTTNPKWFLDTCMFSIWLSCLQCSSILKRKDKGVDEGKCDSKNQFHGEKIGPLIMVYVHLLLA